MSLNQENEFFENEDSNLNYDPETEDIRSNSNKKTGGIIIGIAILLFILAAGSAGLYFMEKSDKEKQIALKQEEIKNLTLKLKELEKTREELTQRLDDADGELEEKIKIIKKKEKTIKSLIWKGARYNKLNKALKELQKENVYLYKKIDSLIELTKGIKENEQLVEDYNRLVSDNNTLTTRIDELSKELEEIKGKGKEVLVVKDPGLTTNLFQATEFNVQTIYRNKNREEKETDKKSKVNVIKVKFNLAEQNPSNRFINIAMGVIIKDAKGNVLTKPNKTRSIFVDGKETPVSMKVKTKYRGPRRQILSFLIEDKKAIKLSKGEYSVTTYISTDAKNYSELKSSKFALK